MRCRLSLLQAPFPSIPKAPLSALVNNNNNNNNNNEDDENNNNNYNNDGNDDTNQDNDALRVGVRGEQNMGRNREGVEGTQLEREGGEGAQGGTASEGSGPQTGNKWWGRGRVALFLFLSFVTVSISVAMWLSASLFFGRLLLKRSVLNPELSLSSVGCFSKGQP